MSGLTVPVLFFCLATGAALGCLFLLFQGFCQLLGGGKWMLALLDLLFGVLAGGWVFLCALAVDRGFLRLYQVVFQGLGAWACVTALWPLVSRGIGGLKKIFCKVGALLRKGGASCWGFFQKGGRPREKTGKKPEKRRKIREKRLETLCRPVYNRNTMGVLFEDERREAAL